MESRIPFDIRDLEALRHAAVALRNREDREASEYQAKGTIAEAPPHVAKSAGSVQVITGRALRKAGAEV